MLPRVVDFGELAAYLRPGKKLKVGVYIFRRNVKGNESLKSLPDKDGVKWWGWTVQNMRPGAENKWLFVAVQKDEE